MKNILIISLLLITSWCRAQNEGIIFEKTDLATTLQKAKANNKYVFIDCYTDWCGPCKQMAKEIFTNPQVAEHFNTTFINLKIDLEKGEGKTIAKQYDVFGLPTFLFLNSDGQLIHKFVGTRTAEEFIAESKIAFDDKNLIHQIALVKEKTNDSLFIGELCAKLKAASLGNELNQVVETYFANIDTTTYFTPFNCGLIAMYIESYDSPVFKFVARNWIRYSDLCGKEVIREKLRFGYLWVINRKYNEIIGKREYKDEELESFIHELKTIRLDFVPTFIAKLYAIKYRKEQNYDKLVETINDMLTYSMFENDVLLNEEIKADARYLIEHKQKKHYPAIDQWCQTILSQPISHPHLKTIYLKIKIEMAEKMKNNKLLQESKQQLEEISSKAIPRKKTE